MDYFHGTDAATAAKLKSGNVDVSKGGGELGMGFYTGEWLWVAKTWAANRHKKDGAVVAFALADDEYLNLEPLLLSRTDALNERKNIKASNSTRTHTFNVNVVWSPIVGTTRVDADQHKFESKIAEKLLNGTKVKRKIV
jgi:hypothetical protein